jgi:hypothetical protein
MVSPPWLALDWASGVGNEAVGSNKMVLSTPASFGIVSESSSSFSDMYVAVEHPSLTIWVFFKNRSIPLSDSESE